MTTITTYTYEDGANYTYDAEAIEVTGGVAKLKDNRPADSTCAALYSATNNLTWGDGSTTATPTGACAIVDNKLDLSGGAVQYVSYDADGNADSQQTGAIRFRYWPNYTGSPAAVQYISVISKEAGSSINLIQIIHRSDGAMGVAISDQAGASITSSSLAAFSPVAGNSYDIEFNWDITAGATRLFVDGIQSGGTINSTGIRSADIGLLRVGSGVGGTNTADFKITNLSYFTTVQHAAAHSGEIPYLDPCKYCTLNPTVVTNSSFKSSELVTFTETSTKLSTSEIKHNIGANGVYKYITGGAVETSDGTYEQANTATEVNADAGEYLSSRTTVTVKSFMHSDGDVSPELDLLTIEHNSALPDPSLPSAQDLEGFIYRITSPNAGLIVKIRPYRNGFANSGVFQDYDWETVGTTDSSGFFDVTIYLNPSSSNIYEIKIGKQSYTMDVSSATGTIDISTIELKTVAS